MTRTRILKFDPLKVAAIFLLLFVLGTVAAPAQTATPSPSPTPKSEEVLRLEEEKAQAELRKAIAEANKAELEAKFPKPTSSPLAGTTTVSDGAVIESQMISYVALARAANRLVAGINKNPHVKVSKLAVFNEDDVRLLLSYKTTRSQIEVLRQSYCNLLAKSQTGNKCPDRTGPFTTESFPVTAGLTVAKSLLGSFVDLTSLLRTNVEIKGQTFDIDEGPLVAEVFRAGRRTNGTGFLSGAQLYYPKIFPPDLDPNRGYVILAALETVQELRNTAGRLIAELEKNGEDIGKAETKVENLTAAARQLSGTIAASREKLSNVLMAHCPKMPPEGRDDVYGMNERLKKYCPDLDGEQRERVFELVSEIKKLDSQLLEANTKKDQAEASLKDLLAVRAQLWKSFGETAAGSTPANAIAVADIAGQLKARNEQFDKFIAALVQAGAGSGANALTSLIKAENLSSALAVTDGLPGKSYWLQLKVLKAGGNNRIKTNLLWDIFTGGNRVSHSGGVIVEYILFDSGGTAIASDTITEYTGYINAGKVKDLPRLGENKKKGSQTSEVDDVGPSPNSKTNGDESNSGNQR
jgi:hypothetical protein